MAKKAADKKKKLLSISTGKNVGALNSSSVKEAETAYTTSAKKRAARNKDIKREFNFAGSILKRVDTKSENLLTSIEKMELTRIGISKTSLEQLKSKAGLDYDQLSHILGVSRATLLAKKGAEKFVQHLSEKIMSLADIYSYGYEVFGNQDQFNQWIFQPLTALGGKTPFDFLDNQYGREEIKHLIGRIDYGVYS